MSTPQYQQPITYAAQPPKTNTLAIISLISSFFISLLGVILGHIALNQIKTTGEGGRGLAIAGLVIGYLGILGGIIAVIVMTSVAATYGTR
jgi:peptidyl-prolyl cis-trans isomerase B (cyclophilin B)